MTVEDLGLSVQVASATPGVTPVAFVARVEVVDQAGELHVVEVASNGITDSRAERIRTSG